MSEATRQAVLTALDVLGYERPTQLRGQRARLDGESVRRVVIERDLLPQCETESIRQDRKHLVGRMVVDPDEVGVDTGRAGEHGSDLGN